MSTTFVQGTLSAQRAKAMSSRGRSIDQEGGQRYTAAALSLVFHPAHPLVPTLRADVRRFEVTHYHMVQAGLACSRKCPIQLSMLSSAACEEVHAHTHCVCSPVDVGMKSLLNLQTKACSHKLWGIARQ